MLVPLEVLVLAEIRRDAFEKELQMQRLMDSVPHLPAPWRSAAGRGLIWAGVRLVNLGTGMRREHAREVEYAG